MEAEVKDASSVKRDGKGGIEGKVVKVVKSTDLGCVVEEEGKSRKRERGLDLVGGMITSSDRESSVGFCSGSESVRFRLVIDRSSLNFGGPILEPR